MGPELTVLLQSDAVPLFRLSPNGCNDVGINRDSYVINPACTTAQHMQVLEERLVFVALISLSNTQMYEFVGALFGMGLRTNVNMPGVKAAFLL